ncbi:MAG: cupin domain-containing protein [Rhodanobacter sp.]
MARANSFVRSADDAPAYWLDDMLWIVLADRGDAGERWSVMEVVMPEGSGHPPHRHLWSDESFYILQGEVTFLIDDTITRATSGDFVSIARNTRHAFRVESETARVLNQYTPASMEAMVARVGRRTNKLPLVATDPAALHRLGSEELLNRYGLIWLDESNPLSTEA